MPISSVLHLIIASHFQIGREGVHGNEFASKIFISRLLTSERKKMKKPTSCGIALALSTAFMIFPFSIHAHASSEGSALSLSCDPPQDFDSTGIDKEESNERAELIKSTKAGCVGWKVLSSGNAQGQLALAYPKSSQFISGNQIVLNAVSESLGFPGQYQVSILDLNSQLWTVVGIYSVQPDKNGKVHIQLPENHLIRAVAVTPLVLSKDNKGNYRLMLQSVEVNSVSSQ